MSYTADQVPHRVIVLYRHSDADSLAFAQYYQQLHGLTSAQLIQVTGTTEILPNYAAFQTQVESFVVTALNTLVDEYGASLVDVIVVGYRVSGGFLDGSDVISTASRLAAIETTYVKQIDNELFNRAQYTPYDADAAQIARVVSRIDAPTLEIAKASLDHVRLAMRQNVVNGTFYFDRYAPLTSEMYDDYSDALDDFESRTLPLLNVNTYTSTFWDEYTDVVIPKVQNDSILWAWRADRAGYTFFHDSTTRRFFLYNADDDGAGAMRDAEDKRWPMLALTSGYAASAGAMSDPTPDGYLRPRPFFEAILRGATVGEAYLYACPFLNWTMTLVGDPLLTFRFPKAETLDDLLTERQGWERMKDEVSSALGFSMAREHALQDAYDTLLTTTDVAVKTELFPAFALLASNVTDQTVPTYNTVLRELMRFPNTGGDFNDFLTNEDIKISQVWNIVLANDTAVAEGNQYEEGSWFVEFPLETEISSFTRYHFVLNVSLFSDFSTILVQRDSESDVAGWTWESETNSFISLTNAGVSSNFAGRRIRYSAPEADYQPRGTILYVRYNLRDADGTEYDDHAITTVVSS
jgi:uncharacterized protein (TIGR03790 family)